MKKRVYAPHREPDLVENHCFVVRIMQITATKKWYAGVTKDAMYVGRTPDCETEAEAIASAKLAEWKTLYRDDLKPKTTQPKMKYQRNTPLFFKKQPSSPNAPSNATFLSDKGEVHGERVCEIQYLDYPWIVRYSEVMTRTECHDFLREKWTKEIEDAKKAILPKTTKVALAEVMKISPATLRKRMKFLDEAAITPPQPADKPPSPSTP